MDRQAEAPLTLGQVKPVVLRKAGLGGAWQRLQKQLRPPPPANPKLVNYLAAGSIQGLPPLRYEKRVARYRLLLLCLLLLLVLWILFGILRGL